MQKKDQLCNTCGDVGYGELIVTCFKCKVVRAHIYCMRNKIHDAPEFWLCDQCVSGETKSPNDSGLKVQRRVEGYGHAKTSKVKCISAAEVIKLSSGGMQGSSKLNMASVPHRMSISRKLPSSSMPQKLFQAPKESQERRCGMMLAKNRVAKKQSLATRLPPIAVKTIKKVKVADILSRASPVPRPVSPVMNTGKEDALTSSKEINIDCSYLPALNASWKGGFRFVNSLVAGKFYGGLLAKPPCTVHCKAYEFSRKMPPVLQVKLLARSDIWDDLFHHNFPGLGDIALYFFPSENIERSRENNSSLFELMERENLLIRSFIDGAELLIFTSRQLDADSQYVINRLNSECLLFGIFRSIENSQSLFDVVGDCSTPVPLAQQAPSVPLVQRAPSVPLVQLAPSVPSVECAPSVSKLEGTFCGDRNYDDSNVVDMEMDMVGGKDMRKPPTPLKDLDNTIQRLLLEFGQKPRESCVNITKKKDGQVPAPISATSFKSPFWSKVKTESLICTEVEGNDDKKWLQTDKCSSTFRLDGSQNRNDLLDEVVSARVADKYLQIFNPGIKKEPH